ncbi:DUF4347 domain-containing protein, partial [Microcoleus sp. BR0-C5]|uniref:DUF4347 domain-containing protein n=1 Tax=Microcoleus sp. BR0-C5 TaxID=2818713 RepID=UPI002FD2B59D
MNVPTANKQIIFVDSSVQDYQSLIQGIDPAQIVILNENSSAIDQITNALADQKDIEAVHIVSHGSEGSLKLGADILNDNNLENFSAQIKQWGSALTANGDILLYGCDVAAGEVGATFVKRLSEITGADVAASTNKTGNAALGGDWELEKTTGSIEASLALSSEAMATYDGVFAPKDTALNLNGGYVGLPSHPNFNIATNRLTVEAWIKPNFTSAWEAIIAKGNSAWRLARSSTSNSLEFAFNSSTGVKYVNGTANVNDGQWHHVGAVYDGTNVLLYIDGVLNAQSNVGSAIFSTNIYNVRIGSNEEVSGTNYNGQIDEVRVWNLARTQAEIQANKDISISPSAGLIGYWKLDEGTGTVAADTSGNSNNATLTGSVNWTVADTTAPTATFTPADNATSVAVAANLVVTLSEAVQKGTGNIVIKKVSDNSVVETINVTSTNVTVSGSSVTVNPTIDLVNGTGYYVEIAAGAIKDLAGNNYAGTTGAT